MKGAYGPLYQPYCRPNIRALRAVYLGEEANRRGQDSTPVMGDGAPFLIAEGPETCLPICSQGALGKMEL